MTSHWPHKVILFPKTPRTYGKILPEYNVPTHPPDLSVRAKKLAGLIPY
jgi:hypothetical protein